MKLYGSEQSGHAYKVRLFLTLAQIEHEYEWVDLSLPRTERQQDFIDVARYGEVPVLVDDGQTHCQSNAILQHLSQKFNIYSGDHTVAEWLFWESNRIGFSLPNYRFAVKYQPLPKDTLAYLLNRLTIDLAILEKHLNQRDYMVGNSLTIADLSCSGYMYWLDQAQINIADYPNIQQWQQNIYALPHWQEPYKLLKK